MADLAQLERALINADKAGDVEAAKTLAGEITRMRGAATPSTPVKIGRDAFPDTLREVLNSADWGTRNIAGAGTALRNLYEGGKQLLGRGDPQAIEEQRIIAQEAPIGAIAGNLAAFAPMAMIPGANTVAGGALAGAVTGAMQPTTEGESRLANAAVGGVVGGAVPAAIRAGKTIKAAVVDPFTQAGRIRIAGGVMNRTAGDAQAAAQRMQAAQGATPGFVPTAGQAADDAGIAALERATRAANPGAFDAADKAQRQALAGAVRGVAGDDVARAAAVDAREGAAQSLYGKAFASDAMRRDISAAKRPYAVAGLPQDNPVTPGLQALAQRPMFAQAVDQARTLAANKGVTLSDPLQSLEGLHFIKLALDDMANPQAASAMGRNASAAVNDMRTLLTDELANISPAYGAARNVFKDMSRPINQMDIGQEFAKRLMPALYRDMDAPAQLNAQAFARALTDQGDDIARSATGMKGARLESIMEPQQMQALRGVGADLQRMKVAENAGRGVGSDTVQKTAMSHIAAQAGIPNWAQSLGRVPGGWAKRVGDAVYGNSDDQVRMMMAELLQNPQEASKAMEAAGVNPSMLAKLLSQGAQGAGFAAIPASINR